MKYLATDPNVPALDAWSMANYTAIEPTPELPVPGSEREFLVSTLSVLTMPQLLALIDGDTRIVTADGIDTRQCTGAGDIQWATLKTLILALSSMHGKDAFAKPDPEAERALSAAQESAVNAQVELSEAKAKIGALEAEVLRGRETITELTDHINGVQEKLADLQGPPPPPDPVASALMRSVLPPAIDFGEDDQLVFAAGLREHMHERTSFLGDTPRQRGEAAFAHAVPKDQCPFDEDTPEWQEWRSGWRDAESRKEEPAKPEMPKRSELRPGGRRSKAEVKA